MGRRGQRFVPCVPVSQLHRERPRREPLVLLATYYRDSLAK